MIKEILIQSCYFGFGRAVNEDGVVQVHAYHLVAQSAPVAGIAVGQLFLISFQIDAVAIEDGMSAVRNSGNVQAQATLAHQE